VEVGKITNKGQHWKNIRETPISPSKKLGAEVHATHLSYTGRVNRRVEVQDDQGINVRPYLKNNQNFWALVSHIYNPVI
jgi:hypothetical protein